MSEADPNAHPATEPHARMIRTVERLELVWLGASVVLVILLFVGVLASFIAGTVAPVGKTHDHAVRRVDPANLAVTPFGTPGLREEGGALRAYVVAKAFTFDPAALTVPAGRPVTLFFTSVDVQHGVQIEGTNINIQLLPGEVGEITHTFTRPGTYRVGCNEYCGSGHHNMLTRIIVEKPE